MGELALTSGNASLSVETDGTFHLKWEPGSLVSADDASSIVAAVQGLSGAGRRPMLVEVVDVCLSPGARTILLHTRFVSAVALVGVSVVDRVVAAALQREGTCPQRYFTSLAEAREWLDQLPVMSVTADSPV